ncbi:MAG: ABC transporter substrate-binding protein [Treponema sp.]|jgi:multiple sugar transport system substrate-binding protein|nr:ABC transporter substrate-binding protein [Treponema sp.]
MKKILNFGLPVVLLLPVLMISCNRKAGQTVLEDDPRMKKLVVWGWSNSPEYKSEFVYFKEDTGMDIEIVVTASEDVAPKLQTTLAGGGELPDIAWIESSFRGNLLAMDIWEDISAPPYSVDKSQVLDYLVPLETTPSGKWVGPECPSVAGMAYKRPLAKEYFGTDDPYELEKLFPTWDAFVQAGIEVQRKSNGKVFMMATLNDAATFLWGQTSEPFVIGDKVNLEKAATPVIERLIQFKKNRIVDQIDAGSPGENASYTTDEHIFYPCANWSVVYVIKMNDRNSMGRWGFMLPPDGPFPWGGTVMGVPTRAINKKGAVTFITWNFLTEKGAALERDIMGNFQPWKPLYYEMENFYSSSDPYFAGQDVLKDISDRVLPNIGKVRIPTRYDQDVNQVTGVAVRSINASNGNVDTGEVVDRMIDDLVNRRSSLSR